MQAQPVRVRPRGDLDGCAPRTLSPGPKSACAHLQAVGDNRYGALPRPGRWRPPRPDPPPVRSCAPPLRAAAVVAPASQPRRPEAYPCRVSRVGAAAQPALRPTALPAPAAAVPLRSGPPLLRGLPHRPSPLSPLVWPPGRGVREQLEEEPPQPGGGGPSPWRTVKEAARRKCATTMTVSGPGACRGAAGRARRGVEGGGSPRGHRHGLPGGRVSGTPARLRSSRVLLSATRRFGVRRLGPVSEEPQSAPPGLTAQSRRPGAPPHDPVPSPALPVPPLAPDLSAPLFQPHPGPRHPGGAAEELQLAGGQVRRAALSRWCFAWTPSLAFVRRVLGAPLSLGSNGRAALPR